MLATLACLPTDQRDYAFEFKWDGVRALCFWDGGSLRLHSRNQLDITSNYPELQPLGVALGPKRRVVLDGEIVAFDPSGRPSFPKLQRRMHVRQPSPSLVRQVPVEFLIFDILYLDGKDLMPLPWSERREILEEVTLQGPAWRVPLALRGRTAGTELYTAAQTHQLEGIVAKELNSPYEPGRRASSWLKVKIVASQEFVIGGWTPEKNEADRERVGNLLLGYYEPVATVRPGMPRRRFRYAGSVGTGFNEQWHRELTKVLKPLQVESSPFDHPVPKAGAKFVTPVLVAQIEYRRWPEGGLVQQAAFKGLRTDKKASSVVKEVLTQCVA